MVRKSSSLLEAGALVGVVERDAAEAVEDLVAEVAAAAEQVGAVVGAQKVPMALRGAIT